MAVEAPDLRSREDSSLTDPRPRGAFLYLGKEGTDSVRQYFNDSEHDILPYTRVLTLAYRMERARACLLIIDLYRGNGRGEDGHISPQTMDTVLTEYGLQGTIAMHIKEPRIKADASPEKKAKNKKKKYVEGLSFINDQLKPVLDSEAIFAEVELGAQAQDELYLHNLSLCEKIAKKKFNNTKGAYQYLDLIQYGNLGLWRAVEKYNFRLGYQFSTYAVIWIKQAIGNFTVLHQLLRYPEAETEKLRKFDEAVDFLTQALGRTPNFSELSAHMRLKEQAISEMHDNVSSRFPDRLDKPVYDGEDDLLLSDTIEAPDTSNRLQFVDRDLVLDFIAELSERDREFLRYRYGLDNGGEMISVQVVGKHFSISREEVKQKDQELLDILRAKFRKAGFAGSKK